MIRRLTTLLLALAPLACAPRAPIAPRPELDPALRASWSEVDAARARRGETSLWDHIELRIGELSGDTFQDGGQGLGLAGRLSLNNPASEAARDDAFAAGEDAARARFDAESLALEATRCLRSVEAHHSAELSALRVALLAHQRRVLTWLEAWLEAAEITELQGAQLRLELARDVAERAEPPLHPDDRLDAHPLPELDAIPTPLDLDEPTLAARLYAHPALLEHKARGREHSAMAESETARRYPWFEFFELSYDIGDGPERITGRVAIEIPFGFDEAADASRQTALSAAAKNAHVATYLEHAREATARLRALERLAAQADDWRALAQAADEAEATALAWLEQQLGEPRAVARLFDEVYATRESILDARLRAGRAACELFALTGVPLQQWPRRP